MRLRYVVIGERDIDYADLPASEVIEHEKHLVMQAIARNQYPSEVKFQVIVEEVR